ncbi:putative ribonuclease H-like domain-containing protein [Tanacetum coccineum]
MDVAHILLGRPWQCDRKTKHDGFQNTYSFKKDGVNITLVPFDSRQTQVEGSNLFMKKTDFEGLMKTSPYVFTLVVVKENHIIIKAPLQVQPLLRELADVIPDDIPPGLLAIRDIQNCIDFIPGSVIPNKPTYRMNPKEFADLQRQVTELLEKGLIQERVDIIIFGCDLEMNGRQLSKLEMDCTSGWLCPSGCLMRRGGRFTWTSEAAKAFDIIKAKVTEAPVLALPNFDEVFQVECDASGVGIGGVLSQNQRPIAFFSEKINDARCKYSTYDKEFYAIVRSLDTWQHYLLSNEFILFSDHEALKFINGQHKLKSHHAKWVEFIQAFSFFIRHKVGSNNQVADALSRRHSLITTMQIRVQGFDSFRGLYCDDPDFSSNAGLYTPLFVPVAPWEDMAHFVPCSKTFDASQVARLYFAEIVKLHGVPKTLTSDRDVKFVSHFWRTLWTLLRSKLQFSSSHHPQTDGQTEVVNRSLGNLLRSLIRDNTKQWDLILPQAEFSYNRLVNRTTYKSPFKVVYGRNPITPIDLVPVPKVGQFNKRRKQVLYREGDLVWIHLHKEHFLAGCFWKLKPRGDGLFRVLKKINDNAYKIELPGHYNVSATFNVALLSQYKGNSDDELDSGSNLFQKGEDDADAVNERVNVTNTLGAYFTATNFFGGLG